MAVELTPRCAEGIHWMSGDTLPARCVHCGWVNRLPTRQEFRARWGLAPDPDPADLYDDDPGITSWAGVSDAVAEMRGALAAAQARAERAETKIAAVRELHRPMGWSDSGEQRCCDFDGFDYPCPTLRALGESAPDWLGHKSAPTLPDLLIHIKPAGVEPKPWHAFRFAAARAVADLVESHGLAALAEQQDGQP